MDNSWKKRIEDEARAVGICTEFGKLILSAETIEDMVAAYKKGVDWALEHQFPSLEALREIASEARPMGVYIDHHFTGEVLDREQVYILHNCTGEIKAGLNVPYRNIPIIYVSSGCDLTVSPSGPSGLEVRVPLYIFGDNSVKAESTGDVTFKIYRNGS